MEYRAMNTNSTHALQQLLTANTDLLFAVEKLIEAQGALAEALTGGTPQYITAQEYARRHTLSVTTVYRHVRTGRISGKFVGKRCLVLDPAFQ
jgi:hypothetical protein